MARFAPSLRPLALVALLGGAATLLAAQAPPAAPSRVGENVTGTVVNATTGKPLANSPVILVQLQGNMQPVATATTDAAGRYRFSETTAGPFMVEADYAGVPYFTNVTAGQSETNVQVYDVSHDPALLAVDAEIMVLQPDAGQLAVVNEYRVENALQPPRTLASKTGLFRFRVPAGAHVDMVRVVGPGEMPLARQALPTAAHDVYSVDSPLRPGETRVQVSYRVPYPGLKATLAETPVTRPAHFEVYVPGPMTFQGTGFSQVGSQDTYTVYGIASGPVAATLTFNVAGDAPMPAAAAGDDAGGANASAGGGANATAGGGAEAGAAAPAAPAALGPTPTPTFLERNLWTMLALLGLAAAAGFGILLAHPNAAPNGAPAAALGLPAPLPPANDDLARLKDDLFLLELRHRGGRLPEADYARLRAELDRRMDQLAGAILEAKLCDPSPGKSALRS